MTYLIELDPETQARLAAAATVSGVAPEAFAGEFLRQHLPPFPAGTGRLTAEGLRSLRAELTKGAENLPVLPPEATARSSFYEDRW